jgi:hypothetical protein
VENNTGTVSESGYLADLYCNIADITDLVLVWLPAAFIEN